MCSIGEVAEWSKAPVLKTGVGQPTVSSNLTLSAKNTIWYNRGISSKDEAEKQIRSILEEWAAAVRAKDTDKVLAPHATKTVRGLSRTNTTRCQARNSITRI